ncbi:MarR family winged helix-turn-helix transcriptional regulator [Methanofollis sp. UBA420]|jgi:DNA-binding PadR family transcriptional regulator|uniref:MarR family winged helix-turn-helix transcriptional regulator n=1 Tax=Methanofollis sp. UBA420 TaxID=1915514 RepID=UPI00316AE8B3
MMNEEVVERYLNLVPLEIREAFNALSSGQRWAVYIALTTEGQKYFNEVKEQFGANPNTMAPILKDLVNGGLVARKVQVKDIGDRRKIYYEPTAMGTNLFATIYEDLLPERSQQSTETPPWLSLKDVMPYYKQKWDQNDFKIDQSDNLPNYISRRDILFYSINTKKTEKILQKIDIADRIDMANWNNTLEPLEQNRLHGPESVGLKIPGPSYDVSSSSGPQYAEVKND